MCALLALSYTHCSEVDEAPSQTCNLGNTSEELSLELAWILAGSIWKMTRADGAWWTGSFDHLQRSTKHRNTPVCAIAAVGLLSLGAAIDQPEQVLCVSGMLACSKTCFKKHSWQCKKRNSFSVSSFDCFGVYVCWEREKAMYSGWVYITAGGMLLHLRWTSAKAINIKCRKFSSSVQKYRPVMPKLQPHCSPSSQACTRILVLVQV